MPVINGVYLKDFTALPSSVTDANIIPIAISGNQIAYRTTVGGIVTDARVTSKLLTGLSVTGGAVVATDTILQAFGKVQNQINSKVSSVGLTMPAAFSVANSPITSAGTLAVTAIGAASQYIRGDGALADFPTTGGGGSSVAYYLNGSVNQGTFVGNTYYEMNKTPVIGTGTDFTIAADGYIAQFITDANDPASLLIPAGNWNVEMYFSASSSGGTPSFYVEVYKYNGTTFTLLGSSATTPEGITNGTAIDIYYTSVGIPETVLAITDRLAIRVYVTHSGRTITLHTEDNHLSEIVTTFSNGLTALNGLTKQAQYFAVGSTGTDFNISSSVDTHTFNIPSASASNRGLITTGTQTIAGDKTLTGALVGTTANFTGQLTLGSTITNGTYTYTLPGATGTLALTSDIHSAVTLSAIGSTPNANAATLTGQVLNLEPASASFGGVVTTGTQTFAGDKTLTGTLYGIGLSMTGTTADIVHGVATSGKAIRGTATTGFGVYASSTTGQAIYAESTGTGGSAVNGTAANGIGGYFFNNATGFATLYVSNFGSGNLANFSNSAGTKFTINNAGNLGNGTYTYTLPSATGTLALTSAIPANPVGGTGTTNYVPKFTGASTIGNSNIQDDGTTIKLKGTTDGNLWVRAGSSANAGGTGVGLSGVNDAGSALVNLNLQGDNINFISGGSAQRMVLDPSGNLGLGVTPSAWSGSISSAIEGRNGSAIAFGFSGLPVVYYLSNAFFNGTSWIYKQNGTAAQYGLNNNDGSHIWLTAPSGTAGNAITFTQAMNLTAGGDLLLNNTSSTYQTTDRKAIVVNGQSTSLFGLVVNNVNKGYFYSTGTNIVLMSEDAAGYMTLGTSNTEAIRIFPSRNVFIGTSPTSDAGYKLDVNGTGRFSDSLRIIKSSNSGSASSFPVLEIKNSLSTQGDGSSTFNFASLYVNSGNDAVNMVVSTTYAAGTWAPAGIIAVTSNHDLQIKTNNTTRLTIASTGPATFSSSVTTGAPSGGTAQPFKVGSVGTGSTFVYNGTNLQVEINGVVYNLMISDLAP